VLIVNTAYSCVCIFYMWKITSKCIFLYKNSELSVWNSMCDVLLAITTYSIYNC